MDKKFTIKYSIEFHTDWHCGSGLAAGADVDALVVKDEKGMPFVPGKTVKGLLREAVEELYETNSDLRKAFGFFDDKEDMVKGCMFFTNAELNKEEYDAIVSNDVVRFMYRDIASTAIDDDGIAKDHSLRKMEVVVPCTLHGEVLNVPNELADEIIDAMKFIKRMGQNRNRGLGRCTFIGRKDATLVAVGNNAQ